MSRYVAIALACGLAAAACSDASIGVLESGVSRRVRVEVDGPSSSLGSWRYHDGVRLLECDLLLEARATRGSSGSEAEWLDGYVDLYDLRTGQYLATDYFYAGELAHLWGSDVIENGERQVARPLRYTSYGPFRAHVEFRYSASGETERARHVFDCR